MKYKVGDVVLVKIKIIGINYKEQKFTYYGNTDNDEKLYLYDDMVFAVVPQAKPEKPEPKFKRGNRVYRKGKAEWGEGIVLSFGYEDDGIIYNVSYENSPAHIWTVPEDNLLPAGI